MNAEKKPRRKLTEADKLAVLHTRWTTLANKAQAAREKYEAALKAAHERAKAAAASLPPLEDK